MSNENELLEPLATEAGQQAIARAINNLGSLENAVRAERAAATATQKADEARNSAEDASDYATEARNWANKTDGYVAQETITIPPEQEGDEPTTETIDLYSAKYYAALAQDIYNNLSFDTEPTENSTALVSSGAIYTALNGKADKSNTYTKTEVDTALGNVQSTLTFDNVPTANSDNPVKSSGIKTALDGKQDNLTFDSTPTANSNNPVTSGGVYTALQNVNIDIDDEITEDSDNPVTSAAIYEALQNIEVTGGAGNASGVVREQIWSGNSPWGTGSITLSKPISDFDFIEFIFHNQADTNYRSSHIVDSKKMQEIIGLNYSFYSWSDREKSFTIDSVTQFTHVSEKNCSVTEIYGIKFSKNLSEQMYSNVLYENSSGVNSGTITLSDSIENYDFLCLVNAYSQDNPLAYTNHYMDINDVKKDYTKQYCITTDSNRYVVFSFPNTSTFKVERSGNQKIYKIIGYKMAQGGYSGIVTDARMTVKSGTLTWTSSINANQTISMDVVFDSPMPDTNYTVLFSLASGIAGHNKSIPRVNQSYKSTSGFTMKMWVDTQIPCTSNDPYVLDWIAIRPNSYTREGMVEDILFSNASGVNSGTINLSGNISDYDLIYIQLYNSSIGYNNSILSPNNFINLNNGVKLSLYDNYAMTISYGSDSSINIDHHNSNSPYITKITGIKFGRYVSGVAVDTTVTQNSDAVITSGAVYDALQNYTPSGGGSSITVDSTITQGGTNPVEGGAIYTALGDKADKSATYTKTEVDTALGSKQGTLTFDTTPTADSTNPVTSGGVYTALQNLPTGTGDVTTNTDQNITGTKTFVGSKKVGFKQSAANDKLGFTLYGNTGTERGYLEFNPQNTIDGVAGLMTLGNYATSAAGLTQVGFRRYSNISGASGAYNLLMPMVADARTPFSLTTSYQNFYLPLGFTDGMTTVKTAKSGLVDLSPLLASLEARIAALEGN